MITAESIAWAACGFLTGVGLMSLSKRGGESMQPENETPEPLGNIEQSEVKNAPGNKFKSAETGKYVTDEFAAANPRTTYAVTKEGRASVDIAAFVESGITESTLELLLNDIRRSSAEYSGKAQLIRAIEKQIERARN